MTIIPRLGNTKVGNYLPHGLHNAELLCGDKALKHDAYCHVDVVFVDVVSQVHASVCLRHTND